MVVYVIIRSYEVVRHGCYCSGAVGSSWSGWDGAQWRVYCRTWAIKAYLVIVLACLRQLLMRFFVVETLNHL
jgi:hypothetical protein